MGPHAKAPAYQWYPKDFETDEAVKLMTYEEEGVYRRLLDHQWLHGSIPADPAATAALLPKITPARFLELWPHMAAKFRKLRCERRVRNFRLEQQRAEASKYHALKTLQGHLGAAKRWRMIANDSSASSSASSSAVRTSCRHAPHCATTWLCGRLRQIAAAVADGRLTREEGVRLQALFRAGLEEAPTVRARKAR